MRTRSVKRERVEVEIEDGEVSKYFQKDEKDEKDEKDVKKVRSSPAREVIDVQMVKKMKSDTYYDWVDARTKDEITYAPLDDQLNFPANFIPIYQKVRLMRSKITTPVDSVGCAMIPLTVGREFGKTKETMAPRTYRFQLLIALMLSSQTKDEVNAKAMFNLMEHCKDVLKDPQGVTLESMSLIEQNTIAELIYPVSFYTRKALYITKTLKLLQDNFGGDIPPDITGLCSLPGVGPKMGYLALQKAWGKVDGIGVDVHVDRLCKMWKWVDPHKAKTPEHTRKLLEEWLPYDLWYEINPVLVGFGQVICLPRGKRCDLCMANDVCNAVDRKLLKSEKNRTDIRKSRGNVTQWMKYLEDATDAKETIDKNGNLEVALDENKTRLTDDQEDKKLQS
ncbi:LADA_0F07030g1_1 [Lachancea dasiensis]|uniref:Endonuclease III homolog n=1 Tax=Lachancea dasiensis TaxID=1072105 RepID=A0A1G4JK29_9SACH|nr:LADA_0F07030g1_1 [Lachancea dasiensis]